MANEHDDARNDAIDKTLAALKNAALPEGLESRIARRLQQQPAPAAFRPRRFLAGSTPAAAWWSGAAFGVASALLAVTAVSLIPHAARPSPAAALQFGVERGTRAPVAGRSVSAVSSSGSIPCASRSIVRTQPAARQLLRAERRPSSHPASTEPLTPQEHDLVRLAQTADPKLLVSLNSETLTRLEAQNAADFAKFFTPSPPADRPAVNPATNPNAGSPATPGAGPEVSPQTEP